MTTTLQMNFFSWAHCYLIGKAERLTVTDIVINYPSSVTLQSFITVAPVIDLKILRLTPAPVTAPVAIEPPAGGN